MARANMCVYLRSRTFVALSGAQHAAWFDFALLDVCFCRILTPIPPTRMPVSGIPSCSGARPRGTARSGLEFEYYLLMFMSTRVGVPL
jgi:hypothetical protein